MRSFIVILLACLMAFTVEAQQSVQWPANKKGAIVLTYDDALKSQLNIAIPQLNKHKLKGTFFLDGRLNMEEMDQWQVASKQGHELGNHSLFHPCSEKAFPAPARYTSENYDVPSMLKEIDTMNKILYGIDRKKVRTYAYPCTEVMVGNRDYTDSLRQSNLITYARIGGDENAVVTDFQALDPLHVPSYALLGNQDGDALIRFVKKVQQEGGLGVLMFHGVGGDYLEVSAEAHAKLLQYLADPKNEIWVGTFQEVMDYVQQQKAPQKKISK